MCYQNSGFRTTYLSFLKNLKCTYQSVCVSVYVKEGIVHTLLHFDLKKNQFVFQSSPHKCLYRSALSFVIATQYSTVCTYLFNLPVDEYLHCFQFCFVFFPHCKQCWCEHLSLSHAVSVSLSPFAGFCLGSFWSVSVRACLV